jgi:hypothetical protein
MTRLSSMDSVAEQAVMRSTIRGYVQRFAFAVELQFQRQLQSQDRVHDELDSFFLAVALKALRESVEWGRDFCNGNRDGTRGKALAAALRAFDDVVPDVGNVRDLQMHPRPYETGSRDRHLPHVGPQLAIYWEADENGITTYVGGYRVEASSAALAAETLADAALFALAD